MTARSVLSDSIDSYRTRHLDCDPDEQEDQIFSLLKESPDVIAAWENLAARGGIVLDDVLSMIIAKKHFATSFRVAHEERERGLERHEGLRKAVNLLKTHYAKKPMLSSPDGSYSFRNLLDENNRRLLDSRKALEWMLSDLDLSERFMARLHNNIFPSGQKRNKEVVDFYKMLSRDLESFFGKPCDDFVAAVSTALFGGNDNTTIDREAVRKARERQRERAARTHR
jgi:hypothetical protein